MSQEDQPLRIEPVTKMSDEIAELLYVSPEVTKNYGARGSGGPNLYGMLAHNPGLLRLFKPLSSFFGIHGLLPARDREIAILRIAWLNQLPFVWGEHVRLGHKAGLQTEEVERITTGSTAPGWNEHDAAILRAVEELREGSDIGDETWAVLARSWNEGQLVELPVLIGQYQTLGYVQNVLRYPLWEGNPGLSAR
ncbi:MAG: carboxymuconolactone decarboxylase family protein [Novosphingobium sp.]